jgi:hypothetical protein
MFSQLILQHPLIALCAVIWVVCGIVAIILKKSEVVTLAGVVSVLIGIGYYFSKTAGQ